MKKYTRMQISTHLFAEERNDALAHLQLPGHQETKTITKNTNHPKINNFKIKIFKENESTFRIMVSESSGIFSSGQSFLCRSKSFYIVSGLM